MRKEIAQARARKRRAKRCPPGINPWPVIEECKQRSDVDRHVESFLSDEKRTVRLANELKRGRRRLSFHGIRRAVQDILDQAEAKRKARKAERKAKTKRKKG